ncbi:MAG: hypothetical protein BWK76_12720 [Desulfobulbaceae bacterium A2]|nr:MAG: hypothetical protein BWK76_12720 [Desulfobulbaceae bacterium A2]
MRIGFLLGSPDINGGTYVIYEHGSRLQAMGHRVAMITREEITPERHGWHPGAANLEWYSMEGAARETFDVVLATWWQSPFLLHQLDARHYVYFVQSIESRFFDATDSANLDTRDHDIWRELCERTYGYHLPMITEARWIQRYLFEQQNQRAWLVPNGIRKDIYTAEGSVHAPRQAGRLRVLVEGPVDVFYKNVPRAVALAREAGVDEVWLLTSSAINSYPGVDRVFSRVPIHETPAVYRSCDVLLKLSYVEGMFGPPLEMFHCGGTAVVYDVTGADEYMENDVNSFVVTRDDDTAIIRSLRQLRQEPDVLARLRQAAADTAAAWPDWPQSTALFAGGLAEIVQQQPASRDYLSRHTKQLFADNHPRLAEREIEVFIAREKSQTQGIGYQFGQDNFAQCYWHYQDQFVSARSQWRRYQPGIWQTLCFEVTLAGLPFWLRLDPSVRLGIVQVAYIRVENRSRNTVPLDLRTPQVFDRVFMNGTISRLPDAEMAVFLSCGEDPQIIVPPVEDGEPGDILHVEMHLRELGLGQYLAEQQQHFALRLAASHPPPPSSCWRRLLGRLRRKGKRG